MFRQALARGWSAIRPRVRIAALGVMLVGLFGAWKYAEIVDEVYGIEFWLAWDVAEVWGWAALWNIACLCLGQCLVVRALRMRELPALESAVLAMGAGVVAFAMIMYAAGALALYRVELAIGLPLAMIAAGARDVRALARELWAELHEPEPRTITSRAITAAGVVCVAIVYMGAFSPDALNYDATWSHQVIAQEYARAGRIVPFVADYNRNVPHLASLIYTWGYLVPGLAPQPLRWMLSLHNEFCLFLWTLAGVSAGVRLLVDESSLRRAWVAFFLFPIIFVYDNNLGGASDHVCGFFSIPIALATLRASERFAPGACVLLGLLGAGAALTKLQALFLVLPAVLVLGVHWLRQLAMHLRGGEPPAPLRHLLWAPVIVAGVGIAVFSPHAIRQWVFHNNPLYPFMQDVFTRSTPTVPNAAFLVSHALADPLYQPEGTLFEKFKHAAGLFVTFSFEPHYSFSRDVPSFGSLFTLLFPCLLFMRNLRLWSFSAIAAGAVLVWGMVYNVDRNLQTFMPVLVCVTGAILVRGWRMGVLARIGLVPLVAVQIVWGADALFYSQHERIRDALDLIRTGYEGEARERFNRYRHEYRDLSRALPRDARVLMHAIHVSLGIRREVLIDGLGFQGLIHYGHLTTPRQLWEYLRRFGITHLVDNPGGAPAPTSQEEVLWDALMVAYAKANTKFGPYRMAPMPAKPPPEAAPFVVASFGQEGYADGLYSIQTLNTIRFLPEHKRRYAVPAIPMPADGELWRPFVERADAVIVQHKKSLPGPTKALLREQYTVIRNLKREFTVHLKNSHFPK